MGCEVMLERGFVAVAYRDVGVAVENDAVAFNHFGIIHVHDI